MSEIAALSNVHAVVAQDVTRRCDVKKEIWKHERGDVHRPIDNVCNVSKLQLDRAVRASANRSASTDCTKLASFRCAIGACRNRIRGQGILACQPPVKRPMPAFVVSLARWIARRRAAYPEITAPGAEPREQCSAPLRRSRPRRRSDRAARPRMTGMTANSCMVSCMVLRASCSGWDERFVRRRRSRFGTITHETLRKGV
jgi:hypothetical protein